MFFRPPAPPVGSTPEPVTFCTGTLLSAPSRGRLLTTGTLPSGPAAAGFVEAAPEPLGTTAVVVALFRLRVTPAASAGSTSRPTVPTRPTVPLIGACPGTCTGPAGSGWAGRGSAAALLGSPAVHRQGPRRSAPR